MTQRAKLAIGGGLTALAAVLWFILSAASQTAAWWRSSTVLGKQDFIQWWRGYRLFMAGADPYNQSLDVITQHALLPGAQGPTDIFNPPSVFVLLCPVLRLGWQEATALWFTLNLILGLLLIRQSLALGEVKPGLRRSAIVFFAALPFIFESAAYGQLSIFVSVCMFSALILYNRRQDAAAGMLLSCLTLKPHLFYLLAAGLGIHALKHKRFLLIISAAVSCAVILFIPVFRSPDIYKLFFFRDRLPDLYNPPTLIVGTVRLLRSCCGLELGWSGWLIPLMAVITLIISRVAADPNRLKQIPLLLGVCLATLPFAWNYDHVVLIPVLAAIAASPFRKAEGLAWVVFLAGTRVAVWLIPQTNLPAQSYLIWSAIAFFPLLTLLALYRTGRAPAN